MKGFTKLTFATIEKKEVYMGLLRDGGKFYRIDMKEQLILWVRD